MYTASQSKTKCDSVVDEILSMIAQGIYKEGDKLPPERYFVEYFGMSRVTIRESFKKLSMLGVIQIKQGEGTFVNRVNLSAMMQPLFSSIVLDNLSVAQIYDARLYVESGMTRLAVKNASPEEIERLSDKIHEMDIQVENRDTAHFSQLDIMFHEYIALISQNHILATTYKTIKDILSKYITTSNLSWKTVEVSQSYHKEIVESIGKRDEAKAAALMEKHIELAKESLIERMMAGEVPNYLR